MATKNYKPTSTGNGKFFWQHFEKVDTDEDGAIDASQFYTAIQNIMNDKSINGGFKDNQPPKWEDLEKNEDGKLDLQDFLMAVQQRWDPHK
jgi:Ca2+-binding EF-hand superfamily protein